MPHCSLEGQKNDLNINLPDADELSLLGVAAVYNTIITGFYVQVLRSFWVALNVAGASGPVDPEAQSCQNK